MEERRKKRKKERSGTQDFFSVFTMPEKTDKKRSNLL